VAHSILLIFQLDEEAREDDTTFVIHRGVIRRGCPTLSERKGGLFFSDAEKFETTVRTWGSAFHHLQLLRKKGAHGDRSGARTWNLGIGTCEKINPRDFRGGPKSIRTSRTSFIRLLKEEFLSADSIEIANLHFFTRSRREVPRFCVRESKSAKRSVCARITRISFPESHPRISQLTIRLESIR